MSTSRNYARVKREHKPGIAVAPRKYTGPAVHGQYVVDPQHHLGLVGDIAVSYGGAVPGHDLDQSDQYGDGLLGLLHACERFDANKGYEFSTYATWCIRGYILRGFKFRARDKRKVHLNAVNFSALAIDDYKSADEILQLTAPPVEHIESELITERLARLPPRFRTIVLQHFWGNKTLKQIGQLQSPAITRERVRQLLAKAIWIMQQERWDQPPQADNSGHED